MATKDECVDLLKWFIELVDKRPDDMYDEEGMSTEELDDLMQRAKLAVRGR